MKVRSGFVSNSSSSSFILFGIFVEGMTERDVYALAYPDEDIANMSDEEYKKFKWDRDGLDNEGIYIGNDENGIARGKVVFGVRLDVDDYYNEYTLEDIHRIEKEIREKFDLRPDEGKMKVVTGSRMC